MEEKIQVRQGHAIDLLAEIHAENIGSFDLVFIDADKQNNCVYFEWALKLTRPGSLIIVDNVVRNVSVTNEDSTDPSVIGVRKLNAFLAKEKRVNASMIQTVGVKGYDGFTIAVVFRSIKKMSIQII
jgi:predicted O-methyltransferase YrrM